MLKEVYTPQHNITPERNTNTAANWIVQDQRFQSHNR